MSASLHAPIPDVGCDVMLATITVPYGPCIFVTAFAKPILVILNPVGTARVHSMQCAMVAT